MHEPSKRPDTHTIPSCKLPQYQLLFRNWTILLRQDCRKIENLRGLFLQTRRNSSTGVEMNHRPINPMPLKQKFEDFSTRKMIYQSNKMYLYWEESFQTWLNTQLMRCGYLHLAKGVVLRGDGAYIQIFFLPSAPLVPSLPNFCETNTSIPAISPANHHHLEKTPAISCSTIRWLISRCCSMRP